MKTIAGSIVALSITLGSVGNAQAAPELESTDNSKLTNICIAATKTSNTALVEAMKAANLTKRQVSETVLCNGDPITDFVEKHGSNVVTMNRFITGGGYRQSVEGSVLANVSKTESGVYELVATNNSTTSRICIAATKENPKVLTKAIRKADLSNRQATEWVKCNGDDLVDFIAQYNANAIEVNNSITNGKYSNSLSAGLSTK